MKKYCPKCKKNKYVENFSARKNRKTPFSSWCKQCNAANLRRIHHQDPATRKSQMTLWRKNNPELYLKQQLKQYNLSLCEFIEIKVAQNDSCAICHTPENLLSTRLRVDHCHETGNIRGLLCDNCNKGLGHFKDNIQSLLNAAAYLQNNNPKLTLICKSKVG